MRFHALIAKCPKSGNGRMPPVLFECFGGAGQAPSRRQMTMKFRGHGSGEDTVPFPMATGIIMIRSFSSFPCNRAAMKRVGKNGKPGSSLRCFETLSTGMLRGRLRTQPHYPCGYIHPELG